MKPLANAAFSAYIAVSTALEAKMLRFPLDEFVRDWRNVMEQIPDGYVGYVTARTAGQDYDLFAASMFDPDLDADRIALEIRSRRFDDAVAFYIHLVRDLGVPLVITYRGRPRWFLEPGPDALDYMAERARTTPNNLARVARHGEIGRKIARRVRSPLKVDLRNAKNIIAAQEEEIAELSDEIAVLTSERNSLSRELAARGSE